ncbi:DUF2723 domain-containing protein [bacterium]|nr:DUF2723 domain-containing protein [bacterium]
MGRASRRKQSTSESKPQSTSAPSAELQAYPLDTADWPLVSVIAIGSLTVYARTLCPTIFTSGAGENVTAVVTLGVPHPPGFPLFCILGKIFTYLIPFGNSAFRVNFFSAVCGAAAAAMFYVLCRTLLGPSRRFAAAAAALLLAFSQTFWSQAVIAEVYTLNALILVCVFYTLIRWEGGGALWPVGLFAGLGLTVHPLQALFLPGWIFFLLRSPQRDRIRFEDAGKAIVAFFGALLLHLYPFLRSKANPALDWGNPENFRNLVAYLTASQYRGRMFSLPLSEVLQNARNGFALLFQQFSPWLSILPVAGAFLLFKKNKRLFIVTMVPAVLSLLYAINYNIPWEIDVYYIPIVLIAAFWTFWLFSTIPSKYSLALPVLAIVPLISNFHVSDRSGNTIALDYGIDLLETAPENATLVLPQTDATFSVLYLTAVEKKRKDLNVWVHRDDGVSTLRDGVNPDSPAIQLEKFLPGKKNVMLAQRVTEETVPGYAQVPYGVLYLLAPKSNVTPTPPIDFQKLRLEKYVNSPPSFYLDDRNRAVLATYHLSRGDNLNTGGSKGPTMQEYLKAEKIGEDLAEIRSQLGLRFADLGNTSAAIAQLRESIQLTESAGDQNRLGRLLAESGRTEEAMRAFIRAIELNPDLAIAHSNLGALLGMKGDVDRALKELQLAVRLDPTNPKAHNNLALVYMKMGRRSDAASEWKMSLNLDPNQPQIKNQLAELKVE